MQVEAALVPGFSEASDFVTIFAKHLNAIDGDRPSQSGEPPDGVSEALMK